MRTLTTAAMLVAASVGLAGCNNAPAPPPAPETEELPVEEAAPAAEMTEAPATDAAAPSASESGPEGGGPSSSGGGRVTPPGQE